MSCPSATVPSWASSPSFVSTETLYPDHTRLERHGALDSDGRRNSLPTFRQARFLPTGGSDHPEHVDDVDVDDPYPMRCTDNDGTLHRCTDARRSSLVSEPSPSFGSVGRCPRKFGSGTVIFSGSTSARKGGGGGWALASSSSWAVRHMVLTEVQVRDPCQLPRALVPPQPSAQHCDEDDAPHYDAGDGSFREPPRVSCCGRLCSADGRCGRFSGRRWSGRSGPGGRSERPRRNSGRSGGKRCLCDEGGLRSYAWLDRGCGRITRSGLGGGGGRHSCRLIPFRGRRRGLAWSVWMAGACGRCRW